MALITLTKGEFAIVDDEVEPLVSKYSWATLETCGHKYAAAKQSSINLLMHRLIVNALDNQIVDHINNNGLDNRITNLRLTTKSLNAANGYSHKDSLFKFKGVRRHKHYYAAQICYLGKSKTIGYYRTLEEAAIAYDYEARKLFGSSGRFNFPFDDEQGAIR